MRSARALLVGAEAALAALTLATVLGMSRLFEGGGWLGPLAFSAVAAHASAAVLRRRGASLPVAGAAMVLAAVLVTTWTSYLSTTTLGIPTGETWSTMQDDLGAAWTLYQDVIAPTPVHPGFLLAASLALWALVFVADWAAFRLWVPFESTLPAGTLFLFVAMLGTDRGRGWAVALYAAALLGFMLLHRLAEQEGRAHWVADERSLGRRTLLTAGASLGLVAVVAGSLIGPALPGADSPGVLDPRSLRDGESARQTISPLVDIRTRLVDQSNVEVFQVRSPQPSYWRLTSLERFDGRIWSSSGSFGEADGELPRAVETDVESVTFEQSFTISALAAIWLPSAYEPRALDAGDLAIRYDEESATLIVDNEIPTSDGLTYTVTSASPRITPADLDGTAEEVPEDIRSEFLQLPDDLNPRVRQLAVDLTDAAGSPYQQALAIQQHLRGFTYDLDVGAGHSGDALTRFLFETQRGYCEQFAGSFAALARAAGLPARVAVGFTQGVVDPQDPELYHVRGEHAHAWPEVYLAGAGWVAFEPTPGRGMPFAESYTGVPASQADSRDAGSATTAPPTTDGASIPTAPSTDPSVRDPEARLDAGTGSVDGAADDSGDPAAVRYLLRPLARALPLVALVVLAYLLLVPLALAGRRWLRRRRAVTADQRVRLAWAEAVDDASVVGFQEHPAETYDERAGHLAEALPSAAADAALLASVCETSAYSAAGATDEDAEAALGAAGRVGEASRREAAVWAKVRRWFDPRPLVETWREERRAGHQRISTTARPAAARR